MAKSPVIYAWGIPSDHGSAIYEVVLRDDGSLECPCPGWVFKRSGQERCCKHVTRLSESARECMDLYHKGKLQRRSVGYVESRDQQMGTSAAVVVPGTRRIIKIKE